MCEMRTAWAAVGLAVVTGLGVTGCQGGNDGDGGAAGGTELGAARLVAFDSCDQALEGFRRAAAKHVGPYGFDGGVGIGMARDSGMLAVPDRAVAPGGPVAGAAEAAPKQAPDHSTTNVHERGVDEPDLVKTDGRRLVSVVDGKLRVVDLASRRLTGTLELKDGPVQHLLLHGDRALLIAPWYTAVRDGGVRSEPLAGDGGVTADIAIAPAQAGSRLVLVDLTGRPRLLSTLSVDGAYVDARQVGGIARVVVRSWPRLRFEHPDRTGSENSAVEANRRIVERSRIEDWLPSYRLEQGGTRTEGRLLDCARVSRPTSYTGRSMVSVLTFDIGRPLGTGDPVTVVADGDTVYATAESLYVAHRSERFWIAEQGGVATRPPASRVEVHKFDISGAGRPAHIASGVVEGTLLNQYSLSEHDGHLRVATTSDEGAAPSANESASAVTVLAQRGRNLVRVGGVGGLGKGERIFAVRFIGPVGYVVTFRQTDPLYTLDLADPRHPRVVGELKINGYSAYLHPAGDGRLIGVGQDATAEGAQLGTQVSLFDVTDPARPRRVAQHVVRSGYSEVESDPHAFLYWPQSGLVVVPVTRPGVPVPLPAPEPGAGGGTTGLVPLPEPGVGGGTTGDPGPVPLPDAFPPGKAAPEYASNSGALVLRLGERGFRELGFLRHPASPLGQGGAEAPTDVYMDPQIRRSLVVGDTLWTVSPLGVMANDTSTLQREAWLTFE